MTSKRVILAGNNAASIGVLDLLLQGLAAEAVLAIAPPRGPNAEWQSSLATAAHDRGVRCLAPADVNDLDTQERVRGHMPTLLLSVYYTQLFGEGLLSSVDGPVLNFHPSLLPRHRGHAPIIWAVASGDSVTGLSVHYIDGGIDTGPLVYQLSIPIHPHDRGFDVHKKMEALVVATAADLLRRWFAGRELPKAVEQTGDGSSHSRRDPQLNRIDWRQPRDRIRDVVRALAPPLPGAFAVLDARKVTIAEVEPAALTTAPRTPGMIDVVDDEIFVWALDGPLRIVSFEARGMLVPGRELVRSGARTGTMIS